MRLRVLRPEPAGGSAGSTPGPERPTRPWQRWLRVPRRRDLRAALRRNAGLKLVSLLLAFFLWFSINVSERDAEGTLEIPVHQVRPPTGYMVTNAPTKPIAVGVRGPRTILDGVDERRVRFALDLASAGPGEVRIELNADMIRPPLPRRLKVVRIEPGRVKVRLERVVRRTLPVRPELAGLPPLGYTPEAGVTPGEVEVSGPASKVEDLKEIKTEPLELRSAPEAFSRTVLLSWAGDFVSFAPDHVTVSVTFQPTLMSRKFDRVEVAVRNLGGGLRAKLVPPRLDLTVQGPQRVLSNYALEAGSVYVDAAGLEPGTYRVTPKIELPQSIEVTRREPEVQTLELTAKGGR